MVPIQGYIWYKKKKKKKKKNMGHNSLTCIFANAMKQSSSISITTGTQIWPYHKKIKGHPSLIIFINLEVLESPMLYTKIQPQSFLSTGEEDFYLFCHIWAWLPSCSMMQKHLNKVSTSLRQQAPCEIWWKLVKWFKRRRLKISWFYTYIYKGARADNLQGGGRWKGAGNNFDPNLNALLL